MRQPEDRQPHSPLALSLLVSESVYRLVVLVERLLRLLTRFVLKPCLLQFRCLFW